MYKSVTRFIDGLENSRYADIIRFVVVLALSETPAEYGIIIRVPYLFTSGF